jgi:hypothetical protein
MKNLLLLVLSILSGIVGVVAISFYSFTAIVLTLSAVLAGVFVLRRLNA